jgi:hypothetical protein
MQPIILEAQIEDAAAVHTLLFKTVDGIEKEERLAGTPHPGQPDHFTGPTRQSDLPRTANGPVSFNKLAQYILLIVAIHRGNLCQIIPSCKDNFRCGCIYLCICCLQPDTFHWIQQPSLPSSQYPLFVYFSSTGANCEISAAS